MIYLPRVKVGENIYHKNIIVDENVVITSGLYLTGECPPKNALGHRQALELLKNNQPIEKIPIFSEGILVIPEEIDFNKCKPEY